MADASNLGYQDYTLYVVGANVLVLVLLGLYSIALRVNRDRFIDGLNQKNVTKFKQAGAQDGRTDLRQAGTAESKWGQEESVERENMEIEMKTNPMGHPKKD